MTLSPNAEWATAAEWVLVVVVAAEWVVAAAEWAAVAEWEAVRLLAAAADRWGAEWEPARLLATVVDRLEAAVSPSDRTLLHREVARRLLPVGAITATYGTVFPSMQAPAADFITAA